ncbi:hypothetical protein TNCV_2973151 [Trichonephila clavipes]|nr:hypothetical protein TNCV_2973151 [Trichonephila clavipes]
MNGHVKVVHHSSMEVYFEYCEEVMFRQMAGRWCSMFNEGRKNVEGEGQSGHPSTSTNENHIARVQNMVLEDRCITVSEGHPHFILLIPRTVT